MSSSQKNLVADLPDGKALVLFDGYCNLCNGAVQFILKRDKKEHFYFASLSWPVAEPVLQSSDELKDVDSIILYDGERVYTRSSAALRISSYMGGLWPLFNVFWIMPKFFRDPVYNFIARNRYKWFGKKDTCIMPDSDVSHRFLNEKRPT
jgi:predicted DCC family thiol-disulfide oxidoreductase YuxK